MCAFFYLCDILARLTVVVWFSSDNMFVLMNIYSGEQKHIITTGKDQLPCCQRCWCALYGIGFRTYERRLNDARSEVVDVTHRSKGMRLACGKKMLVRQFLFDISKIGCSMPDTGEIQLPLTSKHEVYLAYKHKVGIASCSIRYFLFIWDKDTELKKITTPPFNKKRFSKCGTCVNLKGILRKHKLHSAPEWIQARKDLDDHLTVQYTERQYYWNHNELCLYALKHT